MKTVKRFGVITPVLLLVCAILFPGCPQNIGGGPSVSQSGPDSNLEIEGTVVKGYKGEKPTGVLNIPADVTEIDFGAFSDCAGLTQVNFPSGLKKIGRSAFSGCTGLTSLTLPSNLKEISVWAFEDCTEVAGTVSVPANLTTIGWRAFGNCKNVREFDFSPCTQLASIGDWAFQDCSSTAKYKVQPGSPIRDLLLNSHSGIAASQITDVP